MAISFCILASGSTGNCMWVRGGGVEILIDCGLAAKAIEQSLEDVGLDIANVQAVFCTHGHVDHVAGAAVLARRHGIDIHATRDTLAMIPNHPPEAHLHEMPVEGFTGLGGLSIQTTPTLHDAPGSVVLRIADDETVIGLVTDLGVVTKNVTKLMRGVDALLLEMNHDRELLLYGDYPESLKRRIAGEAGHLSNDQAAALLRRVVHPGLSHLTLIHLSESNNTPAKVYAAAHAVLAQAALAPVIQIAAPCHPGPIIRLEPPHSGQLGLPLW